MIFFKILFAFTLATATVLHADIAQVLDPDGYVNVRVKPGTDQAVYARVPSGDFVWCKDVPGQAWLKVTADRATEDGKLFTGWIHRSRLQLFQSLSVVEQKKLLLEILKRQAFLADQLHKRWLEIKGKEVENSGEIKKDRKDVGDYGDYAEEKYSYILEAIPSYFCRTKDVEVISVFLATLWADRDSASELPAISIGRCFACESEMILDLISKRRDPEWRAVIVDQVDWGLQNVYYKPKDKKMADEFKALEQKLAPVKVERPKRTP